MMVADLTVALLSMHTSPLEQPGVGDAGGMNVYIKELAAALGNCGVNLEIFTASNLQEYPEVVQLYPHVWVRHVQLSGQGQGVSLNKSQIPNLTERLAREIASKAPLWASSYDLIHSHYWLSGMVGIDLAKAWQLPLVHTMHTMGKVKNQNLAPFDKPDSMQRIRGEYQITEFAHRLTANTEYEKEELITQYGAQRNKVEIITPGVDLQTFKPVTKCELSQEEASLKRSLGLAADTQLIVFAGRIQPLKGPDVLVMAMKQIARMDPERRIHLLFLGGPSGDPQALQVLQEQVKQFNLIDRIHYRAPVNREQLASWFRVATLVVMPSRSESFGLVALESQACGTPVIAARVGGLRTAVAHQKSGLLVKDHDPHSWACEIAGLLQDERRLTSFRRGAIENSRNFSWEISASKMSAVYDEVSSDFQILKTKGHKSLKN